MFTVFQILGFMNFYFAKQIGIVSVLWTNRIWIWILAETWCFFPPSVPFFLLVLGWWPYKLRSLNNTNLSSSSSVGQKSDMNLKGLKYKCPQGCILSGGCRGESVLLTFPDPRDHLHILVYGLLFFLPLTKPLTRESLACHLWFSAPEKGSLLLKIMWLVWSHLDDLLHLSILKFNCRGPFTILKMFKGC